MSPSSALARVLLVVAAACVAGVAAPARAGEVALVPGADRVVLAPVLEALRDPTGAWTAEDVRRPPLSGAFAPLERGQGIGFVRGAVWLRFTVENASDEPHAWLLTYDFPMMERLDVVVEPAGGPERHLVGGLAVPPTRRDIVHRGPYHEVPLALGARERAVVHVRVETRGSLLVGLSLQESATLGRRFLGVLAAQGLNLGVLLALALLNLYLFLALRDRSYRHHALLILTFAAYELAFTGLGAAFLWPGAPRFAIAAPSLFATLAVPLGIRFARRFLEVRERLPRLDGLRHVAWLAVPCAVLAPFDVRAANTAISIVGPLVLVVGLAWAGASWRAGFRPARFFVAAVIGFLAATLAFVGTTLGMLPPSALATQGVHFGFSFAALVFAFALADRVRGADLQVKEALEDAVRERTRQLEESVWALRREADERRRAEAARHETEEKLRRAQRVEAVGRLAGGVAHDYNNVLTSVATNVGYLLLDAPGDDARRPVLEEVAGAVERGAALTRQLLALGRRQVTEPRPLAPDALVENLRRLLARALGEHVELRLELGAGKELVVADAGQLEQVVMNLVLNARDAMPRGGRITVSTRVAEIRPGEEPRPDAQAGRYVVLAVADTGLGISADVLPHLFEPFFTTKTEGKGSGLGLATVHGIVEGHGGFVDVDPNPGRGAVFRVFFPLAGEGVAAPAARAVAPLDLPRGKETILLVEDEHVVREGTRRLLERLGYHVLAARDAEEALRLAESNGAIHLLLSDVVLGDVSGRELALRLTARWPAVRVILASGHAHDVLGATGALTGDVRFITKPFTPVVLATRIREVLDAPPRTRGVA